MITFMGVLSLGMGLIVVVPLPHGREWDMLFMDDCECSKEKLCGDLCSLLGTIVEGNIHY